MRTDESIRFVRIEPRRAADAVRYACAMTHRPLLPALLVLLAGCPVENDDDSAATGDDDSVEPSPEEEGTLLATNSAGRHGAFFLPERAGEIPLLVLYHASGGDGASILWQFRALAQEWGFAMVAPDSRVSPDGVFTWEVGDHAGEITEDYAHTLACVDEVAGRPDVEVDPGHVAVAGHSGGASSAPWIASYEERFTAFAVLHGGVIEGGIGGHVVPGWFSTGEDDTIRPPDHVQGAMEYMEGLGFGDLEFHVYPGGHDMGEAEKAEMIAWWLEG